MLLSEEPHALEHRLGTSGSRLQAPPQCNVLGLDDLDPMPLADGHPLPIHGAQPTFGLQSSPAKVSQFIAEVAHQQFQLSDGCRLRSFAV